MLVAPSLLDFVVSGPEEGSSEMSIVGVEVALGNRLHIVVGEESGILEALALLDADLLWFLGSERTVDILGSIEINSEFSGQVRDGAVNLLACELWVSVAIVESSEPVSTDISGKRPLSEPYFILERVSVFGVVLSIVA